MRRSTSLTSFCTASFLAKDVCVRGGGRPAVSRPPQPRRQEGKSASLPACASHDKPPRDVAIRRQARRRVKCDTPDGPRLEALAKQLDQRHQLRLLGRQVVRLGLQLGVQRLKAVLHKRSVVELARCARGARGRARVSAGRARGASTTRCVGPVGRRAQIAVFAHRTPPPAARDRRLRAGERPQRPGTARPSRRGARREARAYASALPAFPHVDALQGGRARRMRRRGARRRPPSRQGPGSRAGRARYPACASKAARSGAAEC